MSIAKALSLFCRELGNVVSPKYHKCQHGQVVHHGEHCPDCGEPVAVTWVQLRCQRCETRRKPRYTGKGIQPIDRHCRYCGETAVRTVEKQTIDRYELPLSVLVKYTEGDPIGAITNRTPRQALRRYISQPPPAVQTVSQVLDVVVE